MIALLLERAGQTVREPSFLRELSAHIDSVTASAGVGDRRRVGEIEAAVRPRPERSFVFDAAGPFPHPCPPPFRPSSLPGRFRPQRWHGRPRAPVGA